MTIDARLRLAKGDFLLDAEISIPETGVTALFGASGSGKTTLLRALAGLEPAALGHVRVGEQVWQDAATTVPTHRRGVGYVFQEPSLFPHLSVGGNLRFGLKRTPTAARHLDLPEVAALLGLDGLLGRRPAGLSGGERQRAAIARALLASPRLLLMDEPLSGLDAAAKAEIMPFLDRLHRELAIPVIYVSHLPEEVARLADHMVLMAAGRTVAAGPLSAMLTRVDLPLARAADAQAVVEATVAGREERYRLNHLDFAGGRFIVAGPALPAGRRLRLRVLARDVSLTLSRQHHTSIQNIFAARVTELTADDPAQATVRLMVGDTTLLARLTRKSAEALAITPGSEVFAQVKTVALLT